MKTSKRKRLKKVVDNKKNVQKMIQQISIN